MDCAPALLTPGRFVASRCVCEQLCKRATAQVDGGGAFLYGAAVLVHEGIDHLPDGIGAGVVTSVGVGVGGNVRRHQNELISGNSRWMDPIFRRHPGDPETNMLSAD